MSKSTQDKIVMFAMLQRSPSEKGARSSGEKQMGLTKKPTENPQHHLYKSIPQTPLWAEQWNQSTASLSTLVIVCALKACCSTLLCLIRVFSVHCWRLWGGSRKMLRPDIAFSRSDNADSKRVDCFAGLKERTGWKVMSFYNQQDEMCVCVHICVWATCNV